MKVRRHTSSGLKMRGRFGWFKPGKWLTALSHGNDLRLYLGSFTLFIMAGYFVAALFIFPAPFFAETKAVPNLIGMREADAQAALQAEGLLPGDPETLNHARAPSGSVVWQDPPAGVVVPAGTSIQLSVSQGPQQIPVPDVANYTEELARVLIESAGLTPLMVRVQTPLPAGEVENTRPRAGAPLMPDDTVRILVSIGPATLVMPDLSGMTLEQAQDTLDSLGLVRGDFFPADSRAQEPGTIYQQQPPAGTLTAEGTTVTGWYVRENQ